MSTENVGYITPQQCRGARALLNMTQPKLASASGLGLSTVVDFEKSRRPVSKEAVQAMCNALQDAGIEFIAANNGGVGLRLKSTGRGKRR